MSLVVGFPAIVEEPKVDSAAIDSETSTVFAEIERMRKIHADLNERLDRLATQYRVHFPNELTAIGNIEAAIQEAEEEVRNLTARPEGEAPEEEEPEPEAAPQNEETQEEKDWKKDRKRSVKMMYRRIGALCHPDKTRNLEDSVKLELRTLFVEAKEAYVALNLEQLAAIHATAVSIRHGFNEEDRASIKAERLETLKNSLKGLLSELDSIKGCAMYAVYHAHNNGQIGTAQAIYANILYTHMQSRSATLTEVRAFVEKLKKANQNV